MTEVPGRGGQRPPTPHVDGAQPGRPTINHMPLKDPLTLRAEAITASHVFRGDHTLIHPPVEYRGANEKPAAFGTYSINLISDIPGHETPHEYITQAKAVFVGCMDKRLGNPAYQAFVAKAAERGISEDQILVLSPGGGIIQEKGEGEQSREAALQAQLNYIAASAPSLEYIVVSGHTSNLQDQKSGGCGAVGYYCGGHPLVENITEEGKARVGATGIEDLKQVEATATDAILGRHAADVLGDMARTGAYNIEVWRVTPNEDGTVQIVDNLPINPQGPRLKDIATLG